MDEILGGSEWHAFPANNNIDFFQVWEAVQKSDQLLWARVTVGVARVEATEGAEAAIVGDGNLSDSAQLGDGFISNEYLGQKLMFASEADVAPLPEPSGLVKLDADDVGGRIDGAGR